MCCKINFDTNNIIAMIQLFVKRQKRISYVQNALINQRRVANIIGKKDVTHTVLFVFALIITNQDKQTIIVRLKRKLYYIVIMQWLVR